MAVLNEFFKKSWRGICSQTPRRLVCSVLVVAALIGLLSTAVFAAWDGYGDVGDSSTGSVSGDYLLPRTTEYAVVGYRFSVHTQREQISI